MTKETILQYFTFRYLLILKICMTSFVLFPCIHPLFHPLFNLPALSLSDLSCWFIGIIQNKVDWLEPYQLRYLYWETIYTDVIFNLYPSEILEKMQTFVNKNSNNMRNGEMQCMAWTMDIQKVSERRQQMTIICFAWINPLLRSKLQRKKI